MRALWRSRDRYFYASLQQDLLGDWIVVQCHGGRWNRLHGERTIAVSGPEEGARLMERLHKRRIQRGYVPVETN